MFSTDFPEIKSDKQSGFKYVVDWLKNKDYSLESSVYVDDKSKLVDSAKAHGFGITVQNILEAKEGSEVSGDYVISGLEHLEQILK